MNSKDISILAVVGLGIWANSENQKQQRIEERLNYQDYPQTEGVISGQPQYDGYDTVIVRLVNPLTGLSFATIGVFSKSLDQAKKYPIDPGYHLFHKKYNENDSKPPIYHKISNYHEGDFYSFLGDHLYHPIFPRGYTPECKFYWDRRNFAVAKVPVNSLN